MQRVLKMLFVGAVTGLCAAACSKAGVESSPHFENTGVVLPTNLPFSEAVTHENTVYLSGQIGVKPNTLSLVEGGIGPETRQSLENTKMILQSMELGLQNIIKCTVFLADMEEWGAFNSVYKEYFDEPYPTRSAVGVNGLALDARVEIECIAAVGSSTSDIR